MTQELPTTGQRIGIMRRALIEISQRDDESGSVGIAQRALDKCGNGPGIPFWIGFSVTGITGWHYQDEAGNQSGPFTTRAEAEQHAKESGK